MVLKAKSSSQKKELRVEVNIASFSLVRKLYLLLFISKDDLS